jgi:hypothetical protein
MKKYLFFLFTLIASFKLSSQLKDVKILTPRELGFFTGDYIQFMPDEKYFVVLANSLSIFNTETCEMVDEYELNFGLKTLSASKDGKYVMASVGNELLIFAFSDLKLQLLLKTTTAELLKEQPGALYYSSLPLSGAFFTSVPGQIYVSIGSFTMLYDFIGKKMLKSHAFPNSEYIHHSSEYSKKNEVILAKSSGTVYSIVKQSLDDLSKITELTENRSVSAKIKVRDSLLFCHNMDDYYIMNLENGQIVHEVKAPKYDESYSEGSQKDYMKELNRRIARKAFDTTNFATDEMVYASDLIPGKNALVFATSKGIKVIDAKTGKQIRSEGEIASCLRVSPSGNRMVCNAFGLHKALRVYDPDEMKIIAEKIAMGNVVYYTSISPGNKWLYTGCGTAGYIWDLFNFTKYAEIRDISNHDSSFVSNAFFLSDTELVINSGRDIKHINLSTYSIPAKRFRRVIKKGINAIASGFMNNEFYYCDYYSLHIIDLKTMQEETYKGMFSLAAAPQYHIINFTGELVFVPEAGKYKIINRKTKQAEYESESWSMNTRVLISPDSKFVFTASQIKKKKNYSGTEVETPTNAIVKIDMSRKKIVKDYAETFFPYDFKMKNNNKTIGIWYLKNDYTSTEKESMYTEYDVETGQEKYSKSLEKTPEIISYYFSSDSGKYFALVNYMGNYFKVFDGKGNLVIDLSDMAITAPKCFFIESSNMLIVTSVLNSLCTFVDLKNKKVMGQLANAGGDDYFMVSRDLYYLGSKEFVKNIRFKYKSEMFSFDQFDAYLNQPHKVLRAFNCGDSLLIQAYETAYKKRMKVLGLKPDAKLNFSVLPSIQKVSMREEKDGKVSFSLSGNKGQNNLSKIEVINNGSIIFSENIRSEQVARYENTMTFETSSGINRFEFILKDAAGYESPRITRFYNNTNIVKPDLYLVVIASEKFKNSNYDLSYAVKDASDVAATMANSKSFKSIHIKKMINQNFSSDSVKALKDYFGKAGINDLVMIFYAGHGYLDTDFSYYFPTYYTDFSDPKINSVAYKSFEGLFGDMKPSRKLMFIDACFSGEVDVEDIKSDKKKKSKRDSTRAGSSVLFSQSTALEMSKAIFSDLRHNSGATVISSAGGTEAAYEDEKWNNGLFTYCMLDGLKNLKADLDHDKKVTLNELQKYVSEEVNKLSEGKQKPTYRVENSVLDYELWQGL